MHNGLHAFTFLNSRTLWQNYIATNSIDYHLPKHLLKFVALSINTLALTIAPNGKNVCMRSASVNSGGKW